MTATAIEMRMGRQVSATVAVPLPMEVSSPVTVNKRSNSLVLALLPLAMGAHLLFNEPHQAMASPTLPLAAVGAKKGTADPLPIGEDDPSWGQASAPVTMVFMGDFQCPFTKRATVTVAALKKKYGREKLRVVWKHLPLPFHNQARPAHEAAAAVHTLGGDFWKFYELAFDNQKSLDKKNFAIWAEQAGVQRSVFIRAGRSKLWAAKVDKDLALAKRFGNRGTPHFRINGLALRGALPIADFVSVIDAQLKEGKRLRRSGAAASRVSAILTRQNFRAPVAKKPEREAPDTTVWKVPVLNDDPVRGANNALVTIVEFGDFQCQYCARSANTLKRLLREYPSVLRVVWKDRPMPMHRWAKPAAELARFALLSGGNEGFWAAHDALYGSQKTWLASFKSKSKTPHLGGVISAEELQPVAKELGLDWGVLQHVRREGSLSQRLERNEVLAKDLRVRSTPDFFINGRRLKGAQPYEEFKKLVDNRLAVAKHMVQQGVAPAAVYKKLLAAAKDPFRPERRSMPPPARVNPFQGSAKAPIVIQQFADFQCPFSERLRAPLARALKAYPGKLKIVWRNMPLPFHKEAPLAAEAAQEAFAQRGNKGFFEFHDKLFQDRKALKRADLERYARELQLDIPQFKAALDSRKHRAHVQADIATAKKVGVTDTPWLSVNGYVVSQYVAKGDQPLSNLNRVIELALKAQQNAPLP